MKPKTPVLFSLALFAALAAASHAMGHFVSVTIAMAHHSQRVPPGGGRGWSGPPAESHEIGLSRTLSVRSSTYSERTMPSLSTQVFMAK